MARYDKYDPISGGFRAKLNADLSADANGEAGPLGVTLNSSGRVVIGGGTGTQVGLLVKNAARQGPAQYSTTPYGSPNPAASPGQKAGDVVDIMTSGEIVGLSALAFTPGATIYTDNTTGALTATVGTNTKVGFMIDADRLVVRIKY